MIASLLSALMLATSALTGHASPNVNCAIAYRQAQSLTKWSKYAPIACSDLIGPARSLVRYEADHEKLVYSTVLTVRARSGLDLRIRYSPAK